MIIIYLLLYFCHYCNSASDADKIIDITVYDNTIEVDRLLYGDIIKMDDLYLPTLDNIDTFDDLSESDIKEKINKNNFVNPIWNLDDLNSSNVNKWQDIKEFNEITKSVRNITKNATNLKPGHLTRRYWYQDREDGTDEYYSSKFVREPSKKNRLINLMITFLIHGRYQIKKVMTAKNRIRTDKRYRLGFLYNRMRHLHYEQMKLVSMTIMQMDNIYDYYKDVHGLIRNYERVLRYDVDIIDTIALIKSVDLEKDDKVRLTSGN